MRAITWLTMAIVQKRNNSRKQGERACWIKRRSTSTVFLLDKLRRNSNAKNTKFLKWARKSEITWFQKRISEKDLDTKNKETSPRPTNPPKNMCSYHPHNTTSKLRERCELKRNIFPRVPCLLTIIWCRKDLGSKGKCQSHLAKKLCCRFLDCRPLNPSDS